MRPPGAEEASGRTAAPSTAVGTPPVSRRPSPRRRRRPSPRRRRRLRRPPVSRRLRRPPVSRRRSPRRRRRLRRPPAKLRLRRSHASCARVQRLLTRVDPRRLDGFEGRPESDCAARDGVDHALHYMRCVLAHRKLAKHITKCSGDAGAATRGGRRRTRRPAALLAEARSRARSERTGHAVRSGLEAPLAPRSRCSRRPLDGQRPRVPPPPPHQRSQRRCQAPPLAGLEPRTKRTALLPGAPGHNATARSRHRSRRSQRRIDAPHESAQESRCCSSMAADCCRASRGRQARDGST